MNMDNIKKNNFSSYNLAPGDMYRLDIRENVERSRKQDDWLWWGDMNDYPQFVLELMEKSATLAVCLNSKITIGYGKGVEIKDKGNVLVNRYETISELYYKLLSDLWIFGGFACEIIWSKDGTSIESIYHLPFQNIRVKKPYEEQHERDVEYYYYCENWKAQRKVITRFDSLNPVDRNGRQIYYWKNYTPSNNKFYPLLPWQSGVNSAVLESEIWEFHKTNLATSLLPNLNVSLIGSPTPQEKEEIYEELVRSYSGKWGQKLMLSFSDLPENRPVIETISNNANSSLYVDVLTLAQSATLSSCQISSPLLVGLHIGVANGFSSNADEIKTATQHLLDFVIKPQLDKMNMGLESILSLKYNQPVYIVNQYQNTENL
jgi:hypothetical protein